MEPRHQVSPIEILLPKGEGARIEQTCRSRLVRRAAAFTVASLHRGRGRIPRALHDEAAALDRALKLASLLARGRRDDQAQETFPFLCTLPRCCRLRWSELLRPAPWGFHDRRRLADLLTQAFAAFEAERAARKECAREPALADWEQRAVRRVRALLERGDRGGADEALRALLAA